MSYPPQPGPDQPGNRPPGMPGQPPPGQYPPGQYAPGQYAPGQPSPGQYGYGQPPPGQYGYGQPPPGRYWPPPPPPKKSRTGLIAAIVGAIVLVVAGGAVILATAGDDSANTSGNPTAPNTAANPQDSESPGTTPSGDGDDVAKVRAVADAYVKAVNKVDKTAATNLTCNKTGPGTLYNVGTAGVPEKYRIGAVNIRENKVFATVEIFILGGDPNDPVSMELMKRDAWCVSV